MEAMNPHQQEEVTAQAEISKTSPGRDLEGSPGPDVQARLEGGALLRHL